MNPYLQGLVSGLMNGSSYALLGIGLVLVFRTSRILNLAHGETFVITAVAVVLMGRAGLSQWVSVPLAMAIAATLYWALQRFALQPRSTWATGSLILITLGGAFLVRGVLILAIGADSVSFSPLVSGPPVRFAGAALPRQGIVLIVVGFGLSMAVTFFLSRTRLGKEMTATAENPFAAQLMGINVNAARAIAYGLSGLLSAVAAVLLVPLISIDYSSGLAMTIRGFIAAAIAGMSPGKTVASGLALGVFESMVAAVFGALFQDPVIFTLLIGIAVWQSRRIRFGGVGRA